MSTDSIEKLYKNFGILADAKDKLSEVSRMYLVIPTYLCDITFSTFYLLIINPENIIEDSLV